jgi:hypothetical protein
MLTEQINYFDNMLKAQRDKIITDIGNEPCTHEELTLAFPKWAAGDLHSVLCELECYGELICLKQDGEEKYVVNDEECQAEQRNEFMKNFVESRNEMGMEQFDSWFEKHLIAVEDLGEMGFASAGCLHTTLKRAYGWLGHFKIMETATID